MVGEVVMLESEGGMMAFMVIILTRQDTKSHSGSESTLLQTQLKINIERFHIEHKAYCILEREICILVDKDMQQLNCSSFVEKMEVWNFFCREK